MAHDDEGAPGKGNKAEEEGDLFIVGYRMLLMRADDG